MQKTFHGLFISLKKATKKLMMATGMSEHILNFEMKDWFVSPIISQNFALFYKKKYVLKVFIHFN